MFNAKFASLAAVALISATAFSAPISTASAASGYQCKTISAEGYSRAVFKKAQERRAERKAIRKWEKAAKRALGKSVDFDDAKNVQITVKEGFKTPSRSSRFSVTYKIKAKACA